MTSLRWMELLVLAVLALAVLIPIVASVSALGAGACCLAYGRYYWDRSEHTGARRWPWLRQLGVWRWLARRYRYRRTSEAAVLPQGPCIYACHPHGIVPLTTMLTFLADGGPGGGPVAHLGITSLTLNIPGLRDLALWAGCVDVGRATLEGLLLRKQSVAVIPEGISGMGAPFDRPRPPRAPWGLGWIDRLLRWLFPGRFKERQGDPVGFLRLAWALNVPVVPVHCGADRDVCWHLGDAEPQALTWWRYINSRLWRYPFPTLCCPRPPSLLKHPLVAHVMPPHDPANYPRGEDGELAFIRDYQRAAALVEGR